MQNRSPQKPSQGTFKRMQQAEDTIDRELLKKEDKLLHKIEKYLHLHLDNYESTHGRWIEGTLFLLNMLAVSLFMIETFNPTGMVKTVLYISELSLVSVFIVEYIARFWVAQRKVAHAFSIYSIIDILSILPALVNFVNLTFFRIFRILRIFRLLRVLRFQRMFKAKHTMFGQLSDTQLVIVRIVLTVFTIIFVSSGLIWAIENKVNPGSFGNIFNALYFSVVTLSTVGYGDITPLSPWGKAVTVVMILSGIALIPWQLGKLVKIVVMTAGKIKQICSRCGLIDHDIDAKFCKQCGKKISSKKY
jgi:voltage-gated potassium channel